MEKKIIIYEVEMDIEVPFYRMKKCDTFWHNNINILDILNCTLKNN